MAKRGDLVHANLFNDTLNHPWMNLYIPSVLDEVASETLVTLHVRIWLDDTLKHLPNSSWMELDISLVLGEVCDAHVVVKQAFFMPFYNLNVKERRAAQKWFGTKRANLI